MISLALCIEELEDSDPGRNRNDPDPLGAELDWIEAVQYLGEYFRSTR